MEQNKPKMLFIPYGADEAVRFVTTRLAFDSCAAENRQLDCYSIGDNLTLLCYGELNGKPNPHLLKYKVEYYGPCLIMKTSGDDVLDLQTDIIDQLQHIFEEDNKKREEFIQQMSASGFRLIE